jgi:ferredoxin
MALYITDDCISCSACEPECPNEAIGYKGDRYVIHAERCTECVGFHSSPACQAACPVECCVPDPNHVESETTLLQKALELHPDDEELKDKVARHAASPRNRP